MKLKGKTALVTGAAGGIGRAHALRLARLGADVIINDLDLQAYRKYGEEIAADSVVEEVRQLGVRCLGIEADVCRKEQVEGMMRRVLDELGHIDILINNAGGLAGEVSQSFASSVSEEDLRATLDRNLMGTILCCQAVAEPMKAQRWGRIVNTSSQAALQTMANGSFASYAAAKAGVVAYTRYLAQELGPYGITVNCIVPCLTISGPVLQAYWDRMGDEGQARFLEQFALRRLPRPEDLAAVVLFLCSEESRCVTGVALDANCGSFMP